MASGEFITVVSREPLSEGEWNWDDFDDRRHMVAEQLATNELVDFGLAFVVNELDDRNTANLDLWLTDLGEEARAALKKGLVWDCVARQVCFSRTEAFWSERIKSLPRLHGEGRDRVMHFVKNIPDPRLDHLLTLAMIILAEAE